MPSRPPVRVAFVLHVMQVAGAEVLVYETILRLATRLTPTVFCLDAIGPLGHKLIAAGIDVISFDRRPGIDRSLFGRMAREIRTRGIEVVHAHQYTPFFYASVAARLSGQRPRVIFTEHGRHFPDIVSWKRRWMNRLIFSRLADRVTAVCEFSAKALASVDGFSGHSIEIVPNGIDPDRYGRVVARDALRGQLGLDPTRRYVTIVARFHPVKDHATLLQAFRRVADADPATDLLLVGDGPLRESLEQQVVALGLVDRVQFAGVQSNVPDWLKASDIFVLSSVSEAASITLLEAMACHLPVVVTDVGGNPELVRDGVDGILVPRGDAGRLAEAIQVLLADPVRRDAMGRAGADRVLTHFLTTSTIERYAELYGAASHA